MRSTFTGSDDVFNPETPDKQGIGYQGPVTAPGHRLSTKYCHLPNLRNGDKPINVLREFACLHVIGKTPETGIPPACIG